MNYDTQSIRPFLGAQRYELSRRFYHDIGFEEHILSSNMSYFSHNKFGFYLQNAYVKDWVDNTMVFMEVRDAEQVWRELSALKLPERYENVRLTPTRVLDWGKECFLHDPSGILWHFGEFRST